MTIHKEGYASLSITLIFVIIVNLVVNYVWPEIQWLHNVTIAITAILFLIVLQFFRSPSRDLTLNDDYVIVPADGKVVVIEEVEEPEFLKDKRIQVSIFMSPINVHVNRYPISGKILLAKYHPGKFLVAWHPKSSTENERTTIVVDHQRKGPILIRQVAGALAKRIVHYCTKDDIVRQGSELGFIKFGSRVDVYLPLDTKVRVKIGQHVKGGVDVLAVLAD